jgi:hypothetical protein
MTALRDWQSQKSPGIAELHLPAQRRRNSKLESVNKKREFKMLPNEGKFTRTRLGISVDVAGKAALTGIPPIREAIKEANPAFCKRS